MEADLQQEANTPTDDVGERPDWQIQPTVPGLKSPFLSSTTEVSGLVDEEETYSENSRASHSQGRTLAGYS